MKIVFVVLATSSWIILQYVNLELNDENDAPKVE